MPTILVADDNSNIQKMVSLALKDEGVQIIAVGNGEAAVRKMRESAPDLVLADIFMPVRNGYEVCEYVKRDPKLSHIPVVLLTGAFDPFDEREAQRVGADAVLKKPFVPPDPLVNLVKSLLEKIVAAQLVAVGSKGEFVSNKVVDNRQAAPVGVAVPPAPRRAESRRPEGHRAAPAQAPPEVQQTEVRQTEGRQAERPQFRNRKKSRCRISQSLRRRARRSESQRHSISCWPLPRLRRGQSSGHGRRFCRVAVTGRQ